MACCLTLTGALYCLPFVASATVPPSHSVPLDTQPHLKVQTSDSGCFFNYFVISLFRSSLLCPVRPGGEARSGFHYSTSQSSLRRPLHAAADSHAGQLRYLCTNVKRKKTTNL